MHGIDVIALAFDGECYSLLKEDDNGTPLTMIQLQHNVFEEVKKIDKREIIRRIIELSKNAVSQEDIIRLREELMYHGQISIGGLGFPKNPSMELQQAIKENRRGKNDAQETREKTRKESAKSTKKASTAVSIVQKKKRTIQQPKSLAQLTRSVLESPTYYKAALNVTFSKIVWPSKLKQWMDESPVVHGIENFPNTWFSVPEFNEKRHRIELKVWDSTHLITNLRRVVCTSDILGMHKEAWLTAAKDPSNKLKVSMVEDLPDKQNIGFALTTFSVEVEQSMRKHKLQKEADFCQSVREWWIAEDEPGIPALERIQKRMPLIRTLLKDVDFGIFPPKSSYIKGLFLSFFNKL